MAERSTQTRLYLDADVHKHLANALRLRGYDALSAHEVGNSALTDDEQLAYATGGGRAIFTFNAPDFLALGLEWQSAGRHHAGIILAPQITLTHALQRLSRLMNTVAAEDLIDQMMWLP